MLSNKQKSFKGKNMKKIEILIDPIGNTMNLWWEKTSKTDFVVQSKNTDDVIYYNKSGLPIGVEIIGLFPPEVNISKVLKGFYTLKSSK